MTLQRGLSTGRGEAPWGVGGVGGRPGPRRAGRGKGRSTWRAKGSLGKQSRACGRRPPRASAHPTGWTTVPCSPCDSRPKLSARRCGRPASELAGAAQCPGRCSRPRRPGAQEGDRTASTGHLLPWAWVTNTKAPSDTGPQRARYPHAQMGSGHPGASKSWPRTQRRPCGDLRPPLPRTLLGGQARLKVDSVWKRLGSEGEDGEGPGLWERAWLTAALTAGCLHAGWCRHGQGREPWRLGSLRTAWRGSSSGPCFSSVSPGC